ncbi:uncharacterized protein LOC130674901 [Microplitis mediator]|uniref:uncharacterized protein LOC130674901 n=1 Tax=Microplitis mediator TaxID=375433 RepID=UPI0025523FCB|nr:uncharacterized protein LOC130674901 [Microplitis mediator]
MALKKINSCCCFSLKTGTLIIGIVAMLNYLSFYAILIFNNDVCKAVESMCFDTTQLGTIWKISYNTLGSLLTPLMIYGSLKEDHKLMSPFIVFQAIQIAVEIFIFVANAVGFFIHDLSSGFIFVIIGMIILNILIYLWHVIYSRSAEIKSLNPPSYKKTMSPYEVYC